MNTQIKKKVLNKNQKTGGRNEGPSHPPKNNVEISAEIRVIPRYSPTKNIPNFIPEYSEWYPAINSPSASGISKGSRCVSAIPAIKKTINPINSKCYPPINSPPLSEKSKASRCVPAIPAIKRKLNPKTFEMKTHPPFV